jgi:hypothetical protein
LGWRWRCKYDGEEGKERETKRKRTKTKVGRGIKGKEMEVVGQIGLKVGRKRIKRDNNKEMMEEIGCVR